MPRLLVALTSHGYGHLSQVAPVIRAMKDEDPDLDIALQSDLDPVVIREWLGTDCRVIPVAPDVGMRMCGPLSVDWGASFKAYERFYEQRLLHEQVQQRILSGFEPDLVLADVPWLPLRVAEEMGIPAVGLCSLTWYDILNEGPAGSQVLGACLDWMRNCYWSADMFLQPMPSMPMDWLPQSRTVGPLARRGNDLGKNLRRALGLHDSQHLGLIQLGGVGGEVSFNSWPAMEGVTWLSGPLIPTVERDDFVSFPDEISFADLLASCDLLVTKPGYGSFVEAAVNGIPLLSIPRNEWPESRWLVAWVRDKVPFIQLEADQWEGAVLRRAIAQLLEAPSPEPLADDGVGEVVTILQSMLAGEEG